MHPNARPEAASQASQHAALQRSPDRGILTGAAQGRPHPLCPTNSPKTLRRRAHQRKALPYSALARSEPPPLRFLEKLKRRNVGRVAILYIVVSYVARQVLELPAWAGRMATTESAKTGTGREPASETK
jgi:hypothetical protein